MKNAITFDHSAILGPNGSGWYARSILFVNGVATQQAASPIADPALAHIGWDANESALLLKQAEGNE
jgi:hypothetical protein